MISSELYKHLPYYLDYMYVCVPVWQMSDKLVQNVQLIRFMKAKTFEFQLWVKYIIANNISQFVQDCVYFKLMKSIKIMQP